MGQQEILTIIEKSKLPLSSLEIAKLLRTEEFKVCKHLRVLLMHNEVSCIELDRRLSKKFYNANKRVRLYYV